jgi:glyoxylase-like metal-dependent hydrolase (beta-lactamase superfamily II)
MGIKKLGNITMIQLSDMDSNIYVIGDTVIDSGTGFNFTRLYSVVKMLKMSMGDVKKIINTHAHFDHIGGNGYFLKADIAAHELDADVIEKGDQERSWADYFDGKLSPRPVKFKLKEGDKVDIGGMEFEVLHTPGHTPGSICLYDRKNKILFSGDTIFSDGIGRTDTPGGNEDQLFQSIDKVMQLDINTLLPGHGDWIKENASSALKEMLSKAGEEE